MNGRAIARLALAALIGIGAASCAREVEESPPGAARAAAEIAAEASAEIAAEASAEPTPVHAASVQAGPQSDSPSDAPLAAVEPPLVAPTQPVARATDLHAPNLPSASEAAAAVLDFDSLAKRLRKTKAMKLSAKLAFKRQSDVLLDAFRAYHRRAGTTTLGELRRSYDRLFHELHASLHDRDPPLDRDVADSRAALWEVLTDPAKFNSSDLMAGT
jgi:hypothetical protein